jgi:signal transduction histidine kinase
VHLHGNVRQHSGQGHGSGHAPRRSGCLTEPITAISTNEIGMLGRSFNRMMERLEQNQRVIQELNTSLERKVRERTRELKLAQDRLVHSEKMTSLGELVAGIAHEINNAVNAVYNGIIPLRERIERLRVETGRTLGQVAGDQVETGDGAGAADGIHESFSLCRDLAEVVESGAKRAASIVSDLKKFGHPGEERQSVFDVHEGLKIALNLLHNKLKTRINVEKDFCEDGKILCSGAQLTQVFLNVLDNAQQAISGRGDVCITTRRTDDLMVIRIRDTGSGIPEKVQVRIFDPFFTTKEVGVGTGLGLSISYGIVKAHGGSIVVISPPADHDHGTEFTVVLPITSEELSEENDSSESAAETRAGKTAEHTPVTTELATAPIFPERTTT